MSLNIVNIKCSSCYQLLPTTAFIRNQRNNLFYKTCLTCRTQRNTRRQILRRQRSVVPVLPDPSINDIRSIGNENIADFTVPQVIDTEMELETNYRTTENTNLDINTNSLLMNSDLIFCNVCKQNRAPELYTGRIRGKTYKSCSDCRMRDSNRRRSVAPVLPVPSLMDVESIGNENNTDNINSQIIDIEMETETNSRITETTNLDININNPDMISDLVFCNRCKQNCDSSLFTGRIQGKTYKSCSDCRLRDYNRRRLHTNRVSTISETITNNLGEFNWFVKNIAINDHDLAVDNNLKYCTMCKNVKRCGSLSI